MKKSTLILMVCATFLIAQSSYAQRGRLLKSAGSAALQVGAKKAVDAKNSKTKTEGMTSTTHEKYVNKMVFSAAEIAKGSENEGAFLTSYTMGDPLHFRVYMDNSLSNTIHKQMKSTSRSIINTHARFLLNFYLDGELIRETNLPEETFDSDYKNGATTFPGAFYATTSGYIGQFQFRNFLADAGAKLNEGTHQLKVELIPYTSYPEEAKGEPIIGELTVLGKADYIDPNDETVCLPKDRMDDEKLKAQILDYYKRKSLNAPQKIVIADDAWSYTRIELTGRITKRHVGVIAAYNNDGECIYQRLRFSQDNLGLSYGEDATYMDNNTAVGNYPLPCPCLK